MTSRRSEKRTLRKCELYVESLSARIAPSGFHPGAIVVAGMGEQIGIVTGPVAQHSSPKHLDGTPF